MIFTQVFVFIPFFLDIAQASADVDRLTRLVEESRIEVNQLADKIKQEWENWQIDQKIKLAFQIVGAISPYSLFQHHFYSPPSSIISTLHPLASFLLSTLWHRFYSPPF
jgi:hypothetical protein